MAKFCGNCGAQVSDDAAVCGYCGVPVSGQTPVQGAGNKNPLGKIPGLENVNVDKDKAMKIVKIVAPIVAAVIVIAIAVSVVLANTGVNGAVKKIERAYDKNKPDTIISMICNVAKEHDDDIYDEDTAEEYWSDKIDGTRDYFEEEVDSAKYSIKLDVRDKDELSGKKIKEVFKNYGYTEDDAKGVDKMVKVKAKMIGKHGKEDEKVTVNYYFIKEDGKWNLFTRKNGTLDYYYVEEED